MPLPIWVSLSEDLRKMADEVGRKRQFENRSAGQHDGRVISDPMSPDLQGAWAELVVAAVFKLPWSGAFVPHKKWLTWRFEDGADVGDAIQVRGTYHANGRLPLHPSDKDSAPYVLVRLNKGGNIASVCGWITGAEGKEKGVWEDVGYGRPCYYVDSADLYPINTLPGLPSSTDFATLSTQLNEV